MATVNEHQQTEAMDDAAALEVDVSWLFAEAPAEASVEDGRSSGNRRHRRRHRAAKPRTARHHSPARDEETSQPTVEAGPSCSTQPHRGRGRAAKGRTTRRHTPASDEKTEFETYGRFMKLLGMGKGSRMMQAAKKGAVGTVRRELAAGADVKEMVWWLERETVLHCAAQNGHPEVVRALLEYGAEVDVKNRWGQTPLHRAAINIERDGEERGRAAVVRVLVAAHADPNAVDAWGKIPLHWAVENGDALVVAALLDAGSDRSVRDNDARTPLDIARENNHQHLVDMLK